jgi:hypothetical protein
LTEPATSRQAFGNRKRTTFIVEHDAFDVDYVDYH